MARTSESHEWLKGDRLRQVCEWVSKGLTDKQVANNMGIAESTFYEWKKKYPDFAVALSEAKEKPKLELESAMYKMAIGQMFIEETKTTLDPQNQKIVKIDKVKKQLPPNVQVQMFLARMWMPEKYKEDRADDITEFLNG